jgi:hypothetical protein
LGKYFTSREKNIDKYIDDLKSQIPYGRGWDERVSN